MSLISIYKRIYGAQLNLQKSVVIQLNAGPIHEWYSRGGCRIAERGGVIGSIPVYYLMLFEVSGDEYQQLEAVCSEFFWGLGEQRNPWTPWWLGRTWQEKRLAVAWTSQIFTISPRQ